jgi:hypothetical protein
MSLIFCEKMLFLNVNVVESKGKLAMVGKGLVGDDELFASTNLFA